MSGGFNKWLQAMSYGRLKYDSIKNDPERKSKYVGFGIRSIILGIITPVIEYFLAKGVIWAFTVQHIPAIIVTWIVGIVLAASAVLMLAYLIPFGIICAIRQLNLDRKAGGVIGIIVDVIGLVASVFAVIMAFGGIPA